MAIIDSNINNAENRTSTVTRQPPDLSFEAAFTILQEPSQTQSAEQSSRTNTPTTPDSINSEVSLFLLVGVGVFVVPTEEDDGRLVVEGSYADADADVDVEEDVRLGVDVEVEAVVDVEVEAVVEAVDKVEGNAANGAVQFMSLPEQQQKLPKQVQTAEQSSQNKMAPEEVFQYLVHDKLLAVLAYGLSHQSNQKFHIPEF
ncbi:hypothetical protein MP228_012652 [Amoeboaphelidium protococcarum]|nr:hypothetical protein MP228_012652 [Amoeboaphelidium protococcarum]